MKPRLNLISPCWTDSANALHRQDRARALRQQRALFPLLLLLAIIALAYLVQFLTHLL